MRSLTILAPLAFVLCCGCGSDPVLPASPPIPVKGKITHRGKTLTKGQVTLEPTDGGREAKGDIQPDGTFALTTFQGQDGAVIGVHRVLITGTDQPLRTRKETHVRISEGKTDYVIDLK